ncbi:MAG: glycosyltransferase [Alphaproteobacteria bacterium]
MISVVIATSNQARYLPDTLSALVHAAMVGLIAEVILVDAGSTDGTLMIGDAMGARLVTHVAGGQGAQLAAGAAIAASEWLMFLPADAVLENGWDDEVDSFVRRADRTHGRIAAAFRFALDDPSPKARRTEFWARLRYRLLRLPRGDQGLLISRRFYEHLGGYQSLPAMEDIDLARRIGAERIVVLRSAALSNAERFESNPSLVASLRNLAALVLSACRLPISMLVRLHG